MTRSPRAKISIALLLATFIAVQGIAPSSLRATGVQLAPQVVPQAFAMPAFESTSRRTDNLVASGQVKRTWFWGPTPSTAGLSEEYKQGAGGKRLVQYFDKSRMEVNNS